MLPASTTVIAFLLGLALGISGTAAVMIRAALRDINNLRS